MKVNRRSRRHVPLVRALYINAGLLLAILVALLMRGNVPGLSSNAYGAPQMAPIAGGGGVFLMPAQFASSTWGCYLMDIDTQNICAYEYFPGEHQLRFVAARNYREDRKLKDYNTKPSPSEVAHWNELGKSDIRGATQPPPEVDPGTPQKFIDPPTTRPDLEGPATSEKNGTTLPGVPTRPSVPTQPDRDSHSLDH